MNLWRWIFGSRPPAPEAVQARELATSISRRADEISAYFQTYQRARDPFAAMMADMYNRDQLARIHRGPES